MSGGPVKRIAKIALLCACVAYLATGICLAEFCPSVLGGVHQVDGRPTVYLTYWGIFFFPAAAVHGWIRSAS
jgi:hypothetical protein